MLCTRRSILLVFSSLLPAHHGSFLVVLITPVAVFPKHEISAQTLLIMSACKRGTTCGAININREDERHCFWIRMASEIGPRILKSGSNSTSRGSQHPCVALVKFQLRKGRCRITPSSYTDPRGHRTPPSLVDPRNEGDPVGRLHVNKHVNNALAWPIGMAQSHWR